LLSFLKGFFLFLLEEKVVTSNNGGGGYLNYTCITLHVCNDHRTISLISHTAKIIAKILRRRIERKIEAVLEGDQFGFRRGKRTRNAIGMMRIIAERTLEIEEELCVCFVDWQKALDHVKWTKLMQILKRSGIKWRERRLISKLCMDQRIKVRLD